MKTWQIEFMVTAAILFSVLWLKHSWSVVDIIGSCAVLASFGHGQVSDRMAEKESLRTKPEVSCYRWSLGYFIAKELLWLCYFLMNHSYPALVGVFVFLLYPVWRKVYRSYVKQSG